MKKFLDRLPRAISAKHEHAKRQGAHTYEITARLLDAILGQRVISMQYHSLESRREKLYTVHPSRLIHAQGGLYLIAFVPAYAEVRTFAVERIRKVTVQEVDVSNRLRSSRLIPSSTHWACTAVVRRARYGSDFIRRSRPW